MSKTMDPNSKEFLDALRVSEIGAQIASEIDGQRLAARKAVADQLAALNAAVEKDFPRHATAVDKALAAVRAAEEALKAARDRHAKAVAARTIASSSYTARRNDLEAELIATASPLLSEFVARMQDELRATRKKLTLNVSHSENWLTGAKTQTATSNADRIRARLAAITAAIESAQEAALITDQSKIPDLLFELEAAIPPIEGI